MAPAQPVAKIYMSPDAEFRTTRRYDHSRGSLDRSPAYLDPGGAS
ncbi:MAG: hypothetical protein ACRDMV_03965 [Streptosporangiales bacterium]